jgi:hypothetical protein
MIGGIEVSCEHQEGRPCGQGGGALLELDSAAGFGRYLSAFARVQVMAGANEWAVRGAIDRLYLNGQIGPVALEVGRDVLKLGPGVHTQLIWGTHAPPLDHVRIQTAHPLKIPKIPVTVTAMYAFGLLRDPQTFHNTQVSLQRLAIALFDQVEIGAQQLLQLNGDGAIHFDFADFVAEHFTRKYPEVAASNRRDSLEAVYTNRWAHGLRIYYELAFEDFRKKVVDMFLYDCDHLLGFQLAALTARGRHGLTVELQHNGPYSQEHAYFTTGLTNAGRVIGAPLGPDSWSVYTEVRVDIGRASLKPWFEWARLSSDLYNAIEFGPILVISHGIPEDRVRFGVSAHWPFHPEFRLDGRMLYEHVERFAFKNGQEGRSTADNGGIELSLIYAPRFDLPTRTR